MIGYSIVDYINSGIETIEKVETQSNTARPLCFTEKLLIPNLTSKAVIQFILECLQVSGQLAATDQ